jgi:hypothetical protein
MIIPTIGGARGIFEILVPGMFLLVNLGVVVYLLPFIDVETRDLIAACVTEPVVAVVIGVVFGYLIGLLLRLLQPAGPDRLSAAWLGRRYRRARKQGGKIPLYISERFPYIGYLGGMCRQRICSSDVLDFYKKTWAPRRRRGQNLEFFNFCKAMILSEDERSASEIYAAEAFVRYMSGMFYALVAAFCMILVTFVVRWVDVGRPMAGLIIMLCTYLLAIGMILRSFRFIRIKEAQTVFAASFKNRSIFENVAAPVDEGE